MDGSFLTVLWDTNRNEGKSQGRELAAFDIKSHKTLKDAVTYLVKHGAKYENQEIVSPVNWMPNDGVSTIPTPSVTPAIPAVPTAPPVVDPNTTIARPEVINVDPKHDIINPATGKPKKSIFEGIIPPMMMAGIRNDD